MSRLPIVGGDDSNWGAVLNAHLTTEHSADGTHSVPLTGQLTFKATIVTTGASYSINATTDQIIVVKKGTGSATTLNLPGSPVSGMVYYIKDGKGDAATNNITVLPAAGTIEGSSELINNANYAAVTLVYNGSEWNII